MWRKRMNVKYREFREKKIVGEKQHNWKIMRES